MITLPIPEGMEVPEGPFEIPVTVEVVDGMLMVSSIGGIPVEPAEGDVSEEADFMSAVEQRMV